MDIGTSNPVGTDRSTVQTEPKVQTSRWETLYRSELEEHPSLYSLLRSDPRKLLELAGLTRDEREAWELAGSCTQSEVAQMMHRQVRTVSELIRRAEYKLRSQFGEDSADPTVP